MGHYKRHRRSEEPFTRISNKIAQARGVLSFEARGMILYLLSKPDDWEGQPTDIEAEGHIGKTERRRITIECEKAGYMVYRSVRGKDGRFNQYYEVYDEAVPVPERTRSWEYRKSPPTPGNHTSAVPTEGLPMAENPSTENRGSHKQKNLQTKELQKKEGERPLLTEAELAERTGVKPTADDQLAGQEVLFLTTGKAFCVRKSPELVAWVMNLRRTRGDAGVARVLQALRNPEQHGISRTWATWTIEEALWPSRGGRGAPVAAIPNPTKENALLQTAVARLKRSRELGQSDQDFLAYGTDLSREIKLQAIEQLNAA